MHSAELEGRFELEGELVVSAYDIDGSVLAVDLVDSKGNHFLVADNRVGEHLLRHAGKIVRIIGKLIAETPVRIIEIEKYSINII